MHASAYSRFRATLPSLLFSTIMAWSCGTLRSADERATDSRPLQSGLQVGERVPTFYVRAITGSLKNKSVCYVCRNGDRPVVMLLMRDAMPELAKLLKGIDAIVDENRAVGLRSFGVFLGGEGSEGQGLLSRVQTLAFDENIALPLTISAAPVDGPPGQKVHPAAAVTVVLYRDQRVVSNFAFRTGELTAKHIAAVLESVRKLPQGGEP